MKQLILLALSVLAIGATQAQPNVSINIQQPGVFGRIDIGGFPAPALVLPRPVLIAPPRVPVRQEPIYLYVPPRHQQNWRRYCGQYQACGQPVYFVQDRWVRDRYEERHPGWNKHQDRDRERHGRRDDRHGDRDHGRGHDKHHDRDHGKHRDRDHGHGKHRD
ncbi:hypothetical protein ABIC89_002515 [Variovorax boronicumulans]|uniref:hypothetical protein n=1 Tax=Variovorax boronicumulans TaxID=436515 RepID=UPI0033958D31